LLDLVPPAPAPFAAAPAEGLSARAERCDASSVRLRLFAAAAALVGFVSCVSTVKEYTAFGDAPVHPSVVSGEVGDLVTFEVRPAVSPGSQWSLECYGRVRFANQPTSTSLDWMASPHAVRMETVVSPWDPLPPSLHSSRRWLSYGLRDEGESDMLDRELPIHRVEFKEIAPVTFAATYKIGGDSPTLTVADAGERVVATYRTPTEKGVPQAPKIAAMLLESGNRTILYAEVRTDFSAVPREPMGYDVTLSYAKARVTGPVEVVVVGWVGHDDYWRPFTVTRYPETTKAAPPASHG
jgi:hypothetical protein